MSKTAQIMQFDGQGGAIDIDFSAINNNQALTWIHVDLAAGKQLLSQLGDTPPLVTEVLLAKVTRPRTIVLNNSLLATFRGLNLKKSKKKNEMISIRVWIQENRIITVQRQHVDLFADIQTTLQNGVGPKTAAEFLEALLYAITDQSAQSITNIGDELDQLEDTLKEDPSEIERFDVSNMRRRMIALRRYLIPQREAINRIPIDKVSWLTELNLMHLHEISDASTRVLEDLDAERERANVIHEEFLSILQDNMNQKMYLLSIVAIIFMPLSFITGLLGINVAGIPGATFHHGFAVVCGILLLIFIVQLLLLKRKRWI